jgi:hypothetical protein
MSQTQYKPIERLLIPTNTRNHVKQNTTKTKSTTVVQLDVGPADDSDEELDKQANGQRIYVDNVTPLLTSIFTSIFAVNILYSIATPKDIWILVFILIDTAMTAIKSIISKHYFSRLEIDDLDNLIIMQFFRLIHTTLILMLMKIVYDIITFIIQTSTMYWYNYLDVGILLICFLFVLFTKT